MTRCDEPRMPVLAMTRASSKRHHLAVVLVEARLVVERIDVADAALHEQEDDPLGPRGRSAASSGCGEPRLRRRGGRPSAGKAKAPKPQPLAR